MTVSLSLAVALVASTALPAVCGTKIDAAAEMSSEYTSVYYFTDRADCDDYFSRVVAPAAYAEGFTSDQIFVYDWWSDGNTCAEVLGDYYDSGEFYDVSNALVIFDIQKLTKRGGQKMSPIPEKLGQIFPVFKENGCEIMLVLGVDEMRLDYCGDFLYYVDFHVNTDMQYSFISSLVYEIEEYLAENRDDNFYDYSVCINTLENPWVREWVHDDLIVPYLREKAALPDSMEPDDVVTECADKYNVYWTPEISVPTEYVFALSFNDPSFLYQEWAELLITVNRNVQMAFGEMIDFLPWEEDTEKFDGGIPRVLLDTVDAAVADFIAGRDLEQLYKDYGGRSELSYKAWQEGDGWIKYPPEGGGLDCWQILPGNFDEE